MTDEMTETLNEGQPKSGIAPLFQSEAIISKELSFVYLKRLTVKISKKNDVFLSQKIFIILANSADPDEMPPYAAFDLGLHWLPE